MLLTRYGAFDSVLPDLKASRATLLTIARLVVT
jgi:hypothetical protein